MMHSPLTNQCHARESGSIYPSPTAEVQMLARIRMEDVASTHQGVVSVIIVAPEERELWRSLVHEFKDVEQIRILLDRRYGERRTPLFSPGDAVTDICV